MNLNLKKWGEWLLIVALLVMASGSAFAAANLYFTNTIVDHTGGTLSLSSIQSNGLLEAFWSDVSGSKPVFPGAGAMKIASDVGTFNTNAPTLITDDPSNGKYYGYCFGSGFYFWRLNNASAPGGTVFLRLWDSSSTKLYYIYSSAANDWSSAKDNTFPAVGKNDWYKAAGPYAPQITSFVEQVTTPVSNGTPGTASFNLAVSGADGTGTDGRRQITDRYWKWGTDNPPTQHKVAGGALSLTSADAPTGTKLYFQLFNSNWFQSDVASLVVSHTISGVSVAGGFSQYYLYKRTDGTGANFINIPFDGPMTFVDSNNVSTPITTGQDLVNAIGKTVVTAISSYDNANQVLAGKTFSSSGTVTYSTPASANFDLSAPLASGIYCLSVNSNISFKLKK